MKKFLQGVALAAVCALVTGQALAEEQPADQSNPPPQMASQNDANTAAPSGDTTQAPAVQQ